MPFIEAAGVKTSYQSIGRHEPTLLLLHGWGNDWQSWSALIPLLSQKYRLIIPDLPGFGRSDSPAEGWSTFEYVKWLESFLEKLEVSSLDAVIGHSYGGKLSAFGWFGPSNSLPVPTHGLFLISPSGIPSRLTPLRSITGKLLPLIPRMLRRSLLQPFRTFFYTKILEENDYLSATPFQEATLTKILREDIRQHSKETAIPLHFCWGEKDAAVPLWMAYAYRSISQNADVFMVPDTNHFAHQTQTALAYSWIETHL